MTYIDAMKPDLSAIAGEEVANGDGSYSYRLRNGKFLSLLITTPGAPWGEADSIGPWESFKKSGTALVFDQTWDGTRYTFIRPCVEV